MLFRSQKCRISPLIAGHQVRRYRRRRRRFNPVPFNQFTPPGRHIPFMRIQFEQLDAAGY
jgi:hypothetical protein